MSKFKVGDRVRLVKTSKYYNEPTSQGDHTEGTVTKVKNPNDGFPTYVEWDNGDDNVYHDEDLKLTDKSELTIKEIAMNIFKELKAITLSKTDRLMLKYGITDDCGNLTDEGKDVLLQMVLDDYKDQIGEKLAEVDKEQKAKK